jgi:hypothetical protein
MAVSGRKPKPDGQAINHVKPVHAWIEVPNLPYDGPVPRLPQRNSKVPWSTRAKRKWKAWSSMPHCRLWGEAEWDFALDSLEVAERFYDGESARAAELRTREKQMGTTFDYRRDLRIRYVDPDARDREDDGEEATVTSISDYRDLYGDD